MSTKRYLGELKPGERARVVGMTAGVATVMRRLMELGLLEGAQVELVHQAPFGGDPIAIRVRGALIALRRAEANLLEVRVEEVQS